MEAKSPAWKQNPPHGRKIPRMEEKSPAWKKNPPHVKRIARIESKSPAWNIISQCNRGSFQISPNVNIYETCVLFENMYYIQGKVHIKEFHVHVSQASLAVSS